MERYLDPKNDLLFKKIFGEHKDLLISFLNALLPLSAGHDIVEIEYLSPEQVPEIPHYGKFSIVDVKCIDNYNRSFVVEMQNDWTKAFSNRLLINGAKAIVNQMNKKRIDDEAIDFYALEPVYVLAVVNDEFTKKDKKDWYHHLQLSDPKNNDLVIKGLDYILLELPKFTKETWQLAEKNIAVLWLRFLREINHCTEELSEELKTDEFIGKALAICKESALTPQERLVYDDYLMNIMWHNTNKNLEKKVAEYTVELAKKQTELAEYQTELAEYQTELAEKQTELAENKTKLAEKQTELAENKTELAEYQTKLAENARTIADKDQTIADKDEELAKLKEELKKYKR